MGTASVAGAAGATSAGQVAVANRAGREQVLLSCIRRRRYERLHRSAKMSRSERPYPIFGTPSFVTLGTTARAQPKSCTICLSLEASLSEIDKGLAGSRVGIVLVTPAFLRRIEAEGIADKELSALLARDLLVPIVHNTTYEALREVSPLLGSRSGLSTAEEPMADIAAKLAELVAL